MTNTTVLRKTTQAVVSRMLGALLLYLLALATPAWAAYTDNGNSTVSDSATGLMWDQCSLGQGATPKTASTGPACGGAPWMLNWSQAFEYAAQANAANHRGHSDWRVPTIGELKSLVYTSSAAVCSHVVLPRLVDLNYFPGTDCEMYWASTNYTSVAAKAWYLSFQGNASKVEYISFSDWLSPKRVRLVRGAPFFDPFAAGAAAPTAVPIDTSTARLRVTATANATSSGGTLSAGTTAYYIVVAAGAAVPNAAQILGAAAGGNLDSSAYSASPIIARGSGVVGTTATAFNITGLSQGTAYDVYLIGLNSYRYFETFALSSSAASDLSQVKAPNDIGSPNVIKLSFATTLPMLTYSGNGNTGGSVPAVRVTYASGDTVVVLGNTGALVNAGYVFMGWNTAADGSGTAYAPGATFAIAANTTLYAQWIRYIDHADSTVSDVQTGLIWDQCSLGQTATAKTATTPAACAGVMGSYDWSGAFDAATAANAANYRGYSDWRVPTLGELLSLTYSLGPNTCPVVVSTPAINTVYFPGTACTDYASSTSHAAFADALWAVNFGLGVARSPNKTGKNAVRLVHGGSYFDPFVAGAAAPSVARGGASATLSATATSSGTTARYIVVPSGAPAPNTAQVFDAGTNNLGGSAYGGVIVARGSVPVGTAATSITIGGLAGNTAYDLYLIGVNGANDVSQIIAPGVFGTFNAIKRSFSTLLGVSYHGNGNTSGNVPADETPYAGGETATVLGNAAAAPLARTGYIFSGWNTKADGTGVAYAAGATFTVYADTTLYAHWLQMVNGACGTAAGVAAVAAPSANLCSAGTASTMAANENTFSWMCQGQNTGATASCSAPRQYAVTAIPGAGVIGTLSCAASAVSLGGATTCTAAPGVGYITQSISGCNGTATTPGLNSYPTGVITANCVVTATFSPVDSACGTAASLATLSAPSANLCSANHAASAVSPSANTFDWTCQNQSSSATASCSAPRRYTIVTTATPAAGGSVSCAGASAVMTGETGTYTGGNTVTCTATANAVLEYGQPGYVFAGFSGDCMGSTCALANAVGNKAVTASFLLTQTLRLDPGFAEPFGSVQLDAGPLTLLPVASSRLPAALVSATTDICAVSGSGPYTVSLLAAGICALTATQAGNASYAAAVPLDVRFVVTPAPKRFYIDHGNGTVTDADTWLTWDQCSIGQTAIARTENNAPACNGVASGLSWSQAFDAAASANAASYKGYSDWRLPTVGELSTLVKGKACPTIDSTYFPDTACANYRSSTHYASNIAWFVDFNGGISGLFTKIAPSYKVRLVRGGTFFAPFVGGAAAPSLAVTSATTAMLSLTAAENATPIGGTPSTGTTVHYIVVPSGAVVPNAAQIFDAGTSHLGSGAYSGTIIALGSAVVDTTATYIAITGLTSGTAYDLYLIGTNSHSTAINNDLSQVHTPDAAGGYGVIKLSFVQALALAYDGNGATGGVAPTDGSSPYPSGATVAVLDNADSLVKTGYTFAGWNTVADGSGTAYAAGNTFAIIANTILYAQWAVALQMQTITFTPPANVLLNAGPLTLAPSASSGLAVTLTSTATNICAVSGTGPFTVTLLAVGTCSLTAAQAGNMVYAAATPVNANFEIGAAPLTSFTAPTASGIGEATAAFSGTGGTGCGYTQSQFISVESVETTPPAGYAFPQGLFRFVTANCTEGGTLTMQITYAQPIPAGALLYKFGKTADNPTPHWYKHPATISGSTLTYQVTDGGAGDDDLIRNGSMADPGGPAVPLSAAVAVPMLGLWAQWLQGVLLVLCSTLVVQRRLGARRTWG